MLPEETKTASTDSQDVVVNGKSPNREVRVIREEIQLEDEDDDEDFGDADNDDLLAGLPDDTDEIDLVHARLASVSNLRLPRFAASLKKLCLRQNFISTLHENDFSPLKELEELDLYDNKVKHLDNALEGLPLRVLDLSFNLLRSVPEVIQSLTALHTIYFVQNKISHISGFDRLGATLRSLELGGNKIRVIENLDSLVNLEELWLGKNKISKLENLYSLAKLKILSIQSNRITRIEGLESLVNLEELYISHNGIECLEGLDKNLKLNVLDVSSNKIPDIKNLSHLHELKELWASENKVTTVNNLDAELGKIASLETIYLEMNPCQRLDVTGYRRKIILALPQVKQVDATYVKQV